MRKASRTDANQAEIVRALRQAGCTVQSLATVGKGCPDLLVGKAGRNWLLEIKDGSKPPSARKLTDDENRWHAHWQGQVAVIEDVDQALRLVGENARAADLLGQRDDRPGTVTNDTK